MSQFKQQFSFSLDFRVPFRFEFRNSSGILYLLVNNGQGHLSFQCDDSYLSSTTHAIVRPDLALKITQQFFDFLSSQEILPASTSRDRYLCQFRDTGKDYHKTDCAFPTLIQASRYVNRIVESLPNVEHGQVFDTWFSCISVEHEKVEA